MQPYSLGTILFNSKCISSLLACVPSHSAALQCVREDDRWPTSSDGATAEHQQIKDSLPLRYAYKQ